MKIGVLGSGTVGKTLVGGFLKHGHQAMLGTRDPGKPDIQQWVRETNGASAGTFEQAARFGELVVLATLGRAAEEAISLAGPANLAGKTVMDATNPIAEAPPAGGILSYFTGPNESLGERVQAAAPKARVVKAFNSVGAARMVNPSYQQGPPTMFLCGNDASAKQQVSGIISQFGWEPYDCGGIVASRAIEPLCILWCLRGFQHNQWTHAFKLLTA
ncbi:MAG TPA: NAD(P)-binding domain-containing protein [Bryobacteraceae bacterium]|nr:NAD(P)-binding domain-containing protein [Bryobacteraceae bacterium]